MNAETNITERALSFSIKGSHLLAKDQASPAGKSVHPKRDRVGEGNSGQGGRQASVKSSKALLPGYPGT